MRQWHVDPALLCRKHLLGEHVEHHMMVGTLRKNRSLAGHIERGQIAVHTIIERHAALAAEMKRRGMQHSSPLPRGTHALVWTEGHVDSEANLVELARRCSDCRARQRRAA